MQTIKWETRSNETSCQKHLIITTVVADVAVIMNTENHIRGANCQLSHKKQLQNTSNTPHFKRQ